MTHTVSLAVKRSWLYSIYRMSYCKSSLTLLVTSPHVKSWGTRNTELNIHSYWRFVVNQEYHIKSVSAGRCYSNTTNVVVWNEWADNTSFLCSIIILQFVIWIYLWYLEVVVLSSIVEVKCSIFLLFGKLILIDLYSASNVAQGTGT